MKKKLSVNKKFSLNRYSFVEFSDVFTQLKDFGIEFNPQIKNVLLQILQQNYEIVFHGSSINKDHFDFQDESISDIDILMLSPEIKDMPIKDFENLLIKLKPDNKSLIQFKNDINYHYQYPFISFKIGLYEFNCFLKEKKLYNLKIVGRTFSENWWIKLNKVSNGYLLVKEQAYLHSDDLKKLELLNEHFSPGETNYIFNPYIFFSNYSEYKNKVDDRLSGFLRRFSVKNQFNIIINNLIFYNRLCLCIDDFNKSRMGAFIREKVNEKVNLHQAALSNLRSCVEKKDDIESFYYQVFNSLNEVRQNYIQLFESPPFGYYGVPSALSALPYFHLNLIQQVLLVKLGTSLVFLETENPKIRCILNVSTEISIDEKTTSEDSESLFEDAGIEEIIKIQKTVRMYLSKKDYKKKLDTHHSQLSLKKVNLAKGVHEKNIEVKSFESSSTIQHDTSQSCFKLFDILSSASIVKNDQIVDEFNKDFLEIPRPVSEIFIQFEKEFYSSGISDLFCEIISKKNLANSSFNEFKTKWHHELTKETSNTIKNDQKNFTQPSVFKQLKDDFESSIQSSKECLKKTEQVNKNLYIKLQVNITYYKNIIEDSLFYLGNIFKNCSLVLKLAVLTLLSSVCKYVCNFLVKCISSFSVEKYHSSNLIEDSMKKEKQLICYKSQVNELLDLYNSYEIRYFQNLMKVGGLAAIWTCIGVQSQKVLQEKGSYLSKYNVLSKENEFELAKMFNTNAYYQGMFFITCMLLYCKNLKDKFPKININEIKSNIENVKVVKTKMTRARGKNFIIDYDTDPKKLLAVDLKLNLTQLASVHNFSKSNPFLDS